MYQYYTHTTGVTGVRVWKRAHFRGAGWGFAALAWRQVLWGGKKVQRSWHRDASRSQKVWVEDQHQKSSKCINMLYIYIYDYILYILYICGYICFVSLLGYFKNDIWWTLWQSWLSLVVVASSSISVLQYVLVNPFCRWWIAFRSHF